MSFAGHDYYIQHPDEEKKPVSRKGVTLEQFDRIVNRAATSNADREADAIEKADGYAFQVANPWFKSTDSNIKLVKGWLKSKGITHATYPDILEGAEELAQAGLVSVDEAAYASHLDGNDEKTFRGPITQREYDNVGELIANERAAAIRQLGTEKQSDLEVAFEALPIEEQQQALREAEKQAQANADARVNQQNADSWLTLHPEFRDDERNAKLLLAQMKQNQKGKVAGPFTIEDHEIANQQLIASGLLRQHPKALEKQQRQEVVERAKRAVETPGGAFDRKTEAEIEALDLPLDELRRRADLQLASRS